MKLVELKVSKVVKSPKGYDAEGIKNKAGNLIRLPAYISYPFAFGTSPNAGEVLRLIGYCDSFIT
jgi:hypothetical protein